MKSFIVLPKPFLHSGRERTKIARINKAILMAVQRHCSYCRGRDAILSAFLDTETTTRREADGEKKGEKDTEIQGESVDV